MMTHNMYSVAVHVEISVGTVLIKLLFLYPFFPEDYYPERLGLIVSSKSKMYIFISCLIL